MTQQYVVDQFAKKELSRLNYIKNNQKEMRAELYNGLKDAVTKNDGENIGKIGEKSSYLHPLLVVIDSCISITKMLLVY